MNGKSNLSWRIGMIMMLLCAALVMIVFPAAADYDADKPLTEYAKGTVTGGMDYSIGNSTYSPKLWNYNSTTGTNDSYFVSLTPTTLGTNVTIEKARLYVYWTWAFNNTNGSSGKFDIGVEPNMTVTFNGDVINTTKPDTRYVDWKNDSDASNNTVGYNYPSGTYAYDITNNFTGNGPYVVNIANTKPYNGDDNSTTGDDKESFNIQAVGILILYNNSSNVQKNYWIEEGNDLLYTTYKNGAWQDGIAPSNATASATFSNVDDNVTSATLITVAPAAGPNPAGGTVYNRLFINGYEFGGIWDGDPRDYNFAWEITDAAGYLNYGDNTIGFRDGVNDTTYSTDGQMQAANAFLLTTP